MNTKFSDDDNFLLYGEKKQTKNIQRPKSVSKHTRNSYSYRPKSRIDTRKHNSEYFIEPKAEINEKRYILGLDFNEIKQIYAAKCQDLNIPCLPDQEKRFFNYC